MIDERRKLRRSWALTRILDCWRVRLVHHCYRGKTTRTSRQTNHHSTVYFEHRIRTDDGHDTGEKRDRNERTTEPARCLPVDAPNTNLAHILSICGLPTIIRYCEGERIEKQFRHDVKNQQNFIVVNYWRQFAGNDKDHSLRYGHFSLVAAFDEATDQVLLLDTSNARHLQHWLGVKQLVRMMCTFDRTASMSRGCLIAIEPNENGRHSVK